jgi:hypothetical protein
MRYKRMSAHQKAQPAEWKTVCSGMDSRLELRPFPPAPIRLSGCLGIPRDRTPDGTRGLFFSESYESIASLCRRYVTFFLLTKCCV